jgi:hypothetical protein
MDGLRMEGGRRKYQLSNNLNSFYKRLNKMDGRMEGRLRGRDEGMDGGMREGGMKVNMEGLMGRGDGGREGVRGDEGSWQGERNEGWMFGWEDAMEAGGMEGIGDGVTE